MYVAEEREKLNVGILSGKDRAPGIDLPIKREVSTEAFGMPRVCEEIGGRRERLRSKRNLH